MKDAAQDVAQDVANGVLGAAEDGCMEVFMEAQIGKEIHMRNAAARHEADRDENEVDEFNRREAAKESSRGS